MDRLIATNSVPQAQGDVAPATGTPQFATSGNVATATPATVFPAYAWNMLQEEIRNVLIAAGITPNGAVWNQLAAAIAVLIAVAVATETTRAEAAEATLTAALSAPLPFQFPTGLGVIGSSETLTGANAGNMYLINATGVTITLNSATFSARHTIGFTVEAACTVSASSGTFYGGSLSGSSISLAAGTTIALQWDGVSWRQIST